MAVMLTNRPFDPSNSMSARTLDCQQKYLLANRLCGHPKYKKIFWKGNSELGFEEHVVLFVDILGARDQSVGMDLKLVEYIDEITMYSSLIDSYARNKVKTYSFSDLIVVAAPIKADYHGSLLKAFLHSIGYIQSMHSHQFLVRGGLTIGKLIAEPNVVMGPALVEAYEMESKKIQVPMIGVTEKFLRTLESSIDTTPVNPDRVDWRPWVKDEYLSMIARKEDGTRYVDYLRGMEYHDSTTGDLDFKLMDHKKAMEAAFSRFPSGKTYFLCEYHNRFCIDRKDYLESQSDVPLADYLIDIHKDG